uniref:Uncharacterized protein n=1 Tax=Fagus sylvatica TaxID=28930 RepID=A0A2N9HSF7_FAGSY
MALQASFSLLSWHGAQGTEGRHFQNEHYGSRKYGLRQPRKYEESWSSTPPSGPRRITQWSTADYPAVHNQTQPQKQSAAAPAVMGNEGDDEEDDARAEKTKKSPMAAQIKWSTAAPTETEITTKAEKTREVCHGHHHSRAVTTTAQHSGGPCSSTSQNLGSTVWSPFIPWLSNDPHDDEDNKSKPLDTNTIINRAGKEGTRGWLADQKIHTTETSPLELTSKAPKHSDSQHQSTGHFL